MKKLIVIIGVLVGTSAIAQTPSYFDNLPIGTDTFWDGSDLSGGFADGDAFFHNTWDTAWSYWSAGWAYSNVTDTTNPGPGNLFGCAAYTDWSSTGSYAVGQQGSRIRLLPGAANPPHAVWITNSTYAYISMRDGDAFAKKFGGTSGNDPDWFKVTIRGYSGGTLTNDSVEHYLADFRFSNNQLDYIRKDWLPVSLTNLGNVDSLVFQLSSSDNGSFGINTPAFFCIDDFNAPWGSIREQLHKKLQIAPNPATDRINIQLPLDTDGELQIVDLNGKVVLNQRVRELNNMVDVRGLNVGVYLVNVKTRDQVFQNKLVITQ